MSESEKKRLWRGKVLFLIGRFYFGRKEGTGPEKKKKKRERERERERKEINTIQYNKIKFKFCRSQHDRRGVDQLDFEGAIGAVPAGSKLSYILGCIRRQSGKKKKKKKRVCKEGSRGRKPKK